MPALADEVRNRFEKAGQGHVFDSWGDCNSEEQAQLLEQLDSIKVDEIKSLLKAALEEQQNLSTADDISPFSGDVGRSTDDDETVKKSQKAGLEAISKGQVAALVLAGGQGTRLGFSGPKGMYNIGLPSQKTLFQLLVERIKKLCELASAEYKDASPSIPFYIMTSPINHEETKAFFLENSYFGLDPSAVTLFPQGMLPCLDNDGKIIMETKSRVAMAPDGNGGIYPSLEGTGTLSQMESIGIKYVHVFSIDNALTKPADPAFIGYCIDRGADFGNKVVWKAHAHEKVGVIAERNGACCVVEYSDITTEMAERTDETGRLVFGAGNICNHFYTVDFIKTTILPNMGNMYHVARKKIPYYDISQGTTVKPTENNGIKLESFIFDPFPLSKSMAVYDVLREEEFGPVKNAPGSPSDSPDTARAMISKQAQRWVEKAGGTVSGDRDAICEISPSVSYGGEGLESMVRGKDLASPFSL